MLATLTVLWVKDSQKEEDGEKDVVIVTSDVGIDPSLKLNVEVVEISKSNEQFANVTKTVKQEKTFNAYSDKVFAVYDVSLLNENNIKVQPNGTIKVYMSIPQILSNANFRIYHIHNGVATKVDYEISEDGYAVVTTDKLSEFAIVCGQKSLLVWIIILSVIIILGIIGIIYQIRECLKGNKKNFTALSVAPVFHISGHLETTIVLAILAGLVVIANIVILLLRVKKS